MKHIDTVPPYYGYEIDDYDQIWGRGTVDDKAYVMFSVEHSQSPETCLGDFGSSDVSRSSLFFLKREMLTPKPFSCVVRTFRSRFFLFISKQGSHAISRNQKLLYPPQFSRYLGRTPCLGSEGIFCSLKSSSFSPFSLKQVTLTRKPA